MSEGKVIEMTFGERVEQAKKKAEQAYNEKLERSKASEVDVRDFLTPEELDRILSSGEFFNGQVVDLTKMQRYEKLKKAAYWMNDHCMEVVSADAEKPSSSHPHVIVVLEFRRLSTLRERDLKIFAAMTALADTMFLSGIKDDVIRISFGLMNVWKENEE